MASSLSSRPVTAEAARFALASRLTDRDRELLRELERHGVFTAAQLAELCFDSASRARARLVALHRLGVVDRFRPLAPRWGSAPFHYVLAKRGAGVLAAERGDDPAAAERRCSAGRTLALAGSQRLAHTVGVAGFYVALVADSRRLPAGEGLVRWLTEWEAAKATGAVGVYKQSSVQPDGWGVWREAGGQVEFFLEYDRGTESRRRLVEKMRGYEHLQSERGVPAWVLFAFTSPRREAGARVALADAAVPLATAALVDDARPTAPVWLPLHLPGAVRLGLGALGGVSLPPAALESASRGRRPFMFPALAVDDELEDDPA